MSQDDPRLEPPNSPDAPPRPSDGGEPTAPLGGWQPRPHVEDQFDGQPQPPADSAAGWGVQPGSGANGADPEVPVQSAPAAPTAAGPAQPRLAPPQAAPPRATPPHPQAPPQWGPMPPAYASTPTSPLPVAPATPEGGARIPLAAWLALAATALVLGLGGGFLGSWAYSAYDDSNGSASRGGLETVETRDAAPLDADNGSVAAVAQALLPSTVQIIAEYDGEAAGATGSGFVLDKQGHVVTNNHVVASAAEDDGPIEVVDHDGVRHKAKVVGRSPVYDLAVLSIENARELEPAALGSSEVLHVGDPVVAFGAPLGLSQTVTSGIVSAKDRPVTTGDADNAASYMNAVQTDAAINPGNSGGPLVNLAGEVVGVNSAIATSGGDGVTGSSSGNIGVGFAIPIEQVLVTADQILDTGEAEYPVIGAEVNTGGVDVDGATIVKINEGSPAEAAGLRTDDVVTAVDGKRVADGSALIVRIRTHVPGEKIELTVQRDGSEERFTVTLGGQVG